MTATQPSRESRRALIGVVVPLIYAAASLVAGWIQDRDVLDATYYLAGPLGILTHGSLGLALWTAMLGIALACVVSYVAAVLFDSMAAALLASLGALPWIAVPAFWITFYSA